jgi:hypothetical protein
MVGVMEKLLFKKYSWRHQRLIEHFINHGDEE